MGPRWRGGDNESQPSHLLQEVRLLLYKDKKQHYRLAPNYFHSCRRAQEGLSDPACSGMCAGGHFCPSGSSSPFQRKCGGVDVYCPVGSSEPLEVLEGFYGVHAGPQADLLVSF